MESTHSTLHVSFDSISTKMKERPLLLKVDVVNMASKGRSKKLYYRRKRQAAFTFKLPLFFSIFRFVGDCQISLALKMFIEEKGKELLDKNLYRNFILHVCNLFEFGVLGPAHVFSAISRIQDFVRDDGHSFTSWPHQTTHWNSIPKEEPSAVPPKDLHSKPSRRDFSGIFPKDRRTPYVILEPVDNLLKNAEDEAKRVFLQQNKSSSAGNNASRVVEGSDEDLETKTEKPEADDEDDEEEEIDDDESKNDTTTPSNISPAQTLTLTEALGVKQQ